MARVFQIEIKWNRGNLLMWLFIIRVIFKKISNVFAEAGKWLFHSLEQGQFYNVVANKINTKLVVKNTWTYVKRLFAFVIDIEFGESTKLSGSCNDTTIGSTLSNLNESTKNFNKNISMF